MSRRGCRLGWVGVVAVGLVVVGWAGAVAPDIKDDGKFFSPEAVKKANELIRDIAARSDRDLLIETFATVPAKDLDRVKAMSAKEKTEYFHQAAVERAKFRVVNGIYVLI